MHGGGDDMRIVIAPDVRAVDAAMTEQQSLVERAFAEPGAAVLFIWRAEQALLVTRQDARLPAFARAARVLEAEGWPVLVRTSGGGAFPVHPGTVQFAAAARLPAAGRSIDAIYDALGAPLIEALASFGVAAGLGEVAGAFCRGRHDIVVGGRKLGGLAQHWRSTNDGAARIFAGASVLAEEAAQNLTDVVNRFYTLAGGDFRCAAGTVTSLRRELGAAAPTGDLAAALLQRAAMAFRSHIPLAA